MTTQEYLPRNKFEQKLPFTEYARAIRTEKMSEVCLTLADLCIRYAGIERIPRYHEQHRENDAEHSLMVAILSVELANEIRPDLDKGLLAQYANVHDFIEIIVGDTPTYNLTEQELSNKHLREQTALESLLDKLPRYTAELLTNYERQDSSEARFVRAVDKLTPLLVDIIGPGKMVMCEDYGITSVIQLMRNKEQLDTSMVRRFGEDASEIVDIYSHLGDLFIEKYHESVI